MPSSNIQEILQLHSRQLQAELELDQNSARIEVQCLLQGVMQVSRAYLLSHPEQSLEAEQYARYLALFERRLGGEPIAYLLGEREFFGLTFKVSQATLIPRPETELLVELALKRIPEQGQYRVLDLGTGSGAVALSIAHARANAEVVAVDVSAASLEVAVLNAQQLGIRNAHFLRSDWYSELQNERFDMIVSNPPYIAAEDKHLAQGDVRFEPRGALVSGVDGLVAIRKITARAKEHLNDHGWLLLEHGYDQADKVRSILLQAGFAEVFSAHDLSRIERVSGGKL